MKLFGKDIYGTVMHFIGIGGTGMSGLAEIMAAKGAVVSGSDAGAKPEDIARLEAAGITVHRSHDAAHVPQDALVVVSTAIPDTNPELAHAKGLRLTMLHRAEVLAGIMASYNIVAVSGTHGKTSTAALVYTALKAGGLDVGIINGGIVTALGTNAKLPSKTRDNGGWLVVEADESDASFLKLKASVAVITNIEPEHMATYGSEEKLVQAFVEFADNADVAVICTDDTNGNIVAARTTADVFTYGMANGAETGADVYAASYSPTLGGGKLPNGITGMAFDANVRGGMLEDVVVAMPGAHYVQNSLAALAVASVTMADVVKAAEGLAGYQGVARRFSRVGTWHGASVIDDYGHHPTEIAATLDAAKQAYPGKVVAVIQPHRYTRLRDLMDEFATCAKVADAAILLPVYAAGEAPLEGVTHTALLEKMQATGLPEEVYAAADEHELHKILHHLHLGEDDAVLCLGAGSITHMAHQLAAHHHH